MDVCQICWKSERNSRFFAYKHLLIQSKVFNQILCQDYKSRYKLIINFSTQSKLGTSQSHLKSIHIFLLISFLKIFNFWLFWLVLCNFYSKFKVCLQLFIFFHLLGHLLRECCFRAGCCCCCCCRLLIISKQFNFVYFSKLVEFFF